MSAATKTGTPPYYSPEAIALREEARAAQQRAATLACVACRRAGRTSGCCACLRRCECISCRNAEGVPEASRCMRLAKCPLTRDEAARVEACDKLMRRA